MATLAALYLQGITAAKSWIAWERSLRLMAL
jgi:hypothetical protein